MLNMTHTIQSGAVPAIECVIRVKSGDLAPKGKGALTIGVMPDGKVSLSATLPNASGMPEPFDLTSLDRLELISARKGFYQRKQWIGPAAATFAGFVASPLSVITPIALGVPLIVETASELVVTAYGWLSFTGFIGFPYVAGVYAGSKLNNIARFVAVTNDGRHCIAEMPEAVFRFVQGIKAADNLHIETPATAPEASPQMVEAAPAPA